MSDDDYEPAITGNMIDQTPDEIVGGDAGKSAAALIDDGKSNPFDSAVSDAGGPIKRAGRAIPRAGTLKMLAEEVAKSRAAGAAAPADEMEPLNAPPPKPAPRLAVAAASPAAPAPAPAEAAPLIPPAPSLDPEVMQHRRAAAAEREQAAAERAAIAAERAAWDKTHSVDVDSYSEYVEKPSQAFRKWAESIRGEKFASEDEYKNEVADFVTQLSGDVMGVPLPETVRNRLDAQSSKKAVKAFKTEQMRRETAEAARREQERVDHEWRRAADAIGSQFHEGSEAAKSYAWLAAEESPGKLVVEVIQSVARKDGTQLTWQQASKQADDYLKSTSQAYYDKRKALLSAPPATAVQSGKQDAIREPATGTSPVTPKPAATAPIEPPTPELPRATARWTAESHRRKTREAFRGMKHGE